MDLVNLPSLPFPLAGLPLALPAITPLAAPCIACFIPPRYQRTLTCRCVSVNALTGAGTACRTCKIETMREQSCHLQSSQREEAYCTVEAETRLMMDGRKSGKQGVGAGWVDPGVFRNATTTAATVSSWHVHMLTPEEHIGSSQHLGVAQSSVPSAKVPPYNRVLCKMLQLLAVAGCDAGLCMLQLHAWPYG